MQKKLLSLVLFSFIISQNALAGDITKKDIIRKTLQFSKTADSRVVEVDNINGSIEVYGENRSDVLLIVEKKIRARTIKKVEEAREKIKLEISENDASLLIYVDAPYRRDDGSVNHKSYQHYGYDVTFDIELKVPFETDFYLKTINEGNISVCDVSGDYDVKNINGSIEMIGLAGSGKVYALNGEVELDFDKNPKSDCYFGSLNDDVNISFQKDFSADLLIKTFNGDVYSDFPVTYLPDKTFEKKKKGKKFVYKAGKNTKVRVGNGGPEIELDGFNGDINVLKK